MSFCGIAIEQIFSGCEQFDERKRTDRRAKSSGEFVAVSVGGYCGSHCLNRDGLVENVEKTHAPEEIELDVAVRR